MTDRSSAPEWLANKGGLEDEDFTEPVATNDTVEDAPIRSMSFETRIDRDEKVRQAVKQLRMTVPQILEFSQCWEHPFYDEKSVWRRITALNLKRRVKRVAEQSLHDFFSIKIGLKIWKDAHRNGVPVTNIEKESSIPDARIRADFRYNLGHRLFFHENQRSALTYMGWKQKLTKYVKYRRTPGTKPFRVLITMDDERSLNTVYGYAKDVTEDFPELCIFLLAWQPDFLGQYDTTTEPIWVTNRIVAGKHETVSLMG